MSTKEELERIWREEPHGHRKRSKAAPVARDWDQDYVQDYKKRTQRDQWMHELYGARLRLVSWRAEVLAKPHEPQPAKTLKRVITGAERLLGHIRGDWAERWRGDYGHLLEHPNTSPYLQTSR